MAQQWNSARRLTIGALVLVTMSNLLVNEIEAGQGCPFDNGSCQEYCNQQGCSMGYCGHFAWIQCICRKCGNEWSYYDKIRFTTGYQNQSVNQTELESLKLNQSLPIIMMTTNEDGVTTVNITETLQPELEIVSVDDSQLIDMISATTSANTDTDTNRNPNPNLDQAEASTDPNSASGSPDPAESSDLSQLTVTGPTDTQQTDATTTTPSTSNNPVADNVGGGTLLVPDLSDEQDPDANEVDEADTDKLLEMAEKHYNRLKQNETSSGGDRTQTVIDDGGVNRFQRRKRNTITIDQIRDMMQRV